MGRIGVHIQKLHEDAKIPQIQTIQSVGYDLHAYLAEGISLKLCEIWPGEVKMVPCGFKMALPGDHEAQIRARGSMAKKGIIIPNSPGTVDPDYRGEVMVLLMNLGKSMQEITHGDRIAQMVFAKVVRPSLVIVKALDPTERGEGRMGSTGQ